MTPEDQFREAIAYAEGLQEEGRWEEAGETFARAGAVATDFGAVDAARQAWGAAGEAFRRADRVVRARDALRVALSSGRPAPADRIVLQVRLASCLTEVGNGDGARALLESARVDLSVGHPLHALVTDALVGTLLGYGSPEQLSEIPGLVVALQGNAWSHLLRSGQWLRLQGQLDAADQRFAELEEALRGVDGAGAGLGGVRCERAEIAAFRGDAAASAAVWAEAARDHESAGRISLMWRAEAGRVRCLVQAGLEPFPNRLADGLAWAAERQLESLRVDLGLADAIARRDSVALERVRDRALELGMPRRAGRAELARAERLEGLARLPVLQRAIDLLRGDVPHTLRARVAHAEALAGASPASGVTAAGRLMDDVALAGMHPELERLRRIVED